MYETWSFTLLEEHRLRVFENKKVRRTSESKREEVTEKWRRLHKELCDLYCSPTIIWLIISRLIRWVEHVQRMGDWRGAYNVWMKKN